MFTADFIDAHFIGLATRTMVQHLTPECLANGNGYIFTLTSDLQRKSVMVNGHSITFKKRNDAITAWHEYVDIFRKQERITSLPHAIAPCSSPNNTAQSGEIGRNTDVTKQAQNSAENEDL